MNKQGIWDLLEEWDLSVPRKIHLIACGRTALVLQNIAESQETLEFIVPDEEEYSALAETLSRLGLKQKGSSWSGEGGLRLDLFQGSGLYGLALLESPLKEENNLPLRSFFRIYAGALNDFDLAASLIFRGAPEDAENCLALIRARGESFDKIKFEQRFLKTAGAQKGAEELLGRLKNLMKRLKENS